MTQFQQVAFGELVSIIANGLVNPFGFDRINAGDICIDQYLLATDFNQHFLNCLNGDRVGHGAMKWMPFRADQTGDWSNSGVGKQPDGVSPWILDWGEWGDDR